MDDTDAYAKMLQEKQHLAQSFLELVALTEEMQKVLERQEHSICLGIARTISATRVPRFECKTCRGTDVACFECKASQKVQQGIESFRDSLSSNVLSLAHNRMSNVDAASRRPYDLPPLSLESLQLAYDIACETLLPNSPSGFVN